MMQWVFHEEVPDNPTLYTRAIVGDRFPTPLSPLTATAGAAAHFRHTWSAVQAELGVVAFEQAEPGTAIFGGRLYVNTSVMRLLGERSFGADPLAFTRQYLGERPDGSRQRVRLSRREDRDAVHAWATLAARTAACGEAGQIARRARWLRSERPRLEQLAPLKLAALLKGARRHLAEAVRLYAETELARGLHTELLTRCVEHTGQPALTGELVAGWAPTDHQLAGALWRLGRVVRRSRRLEQLFDRGPIHQVADRLSQPHGDHDAFRAMLEKIRSEHGHIGPGEWELSGDTWESRPDLLLAVVNLLRSAGHDVAPRARTITRAERVGTLTEAVRHALRTMPAGLARFEELIVRTRVIARAAQQAREAVSVINHEIRVVARELGRRAIATGHLDSLDQIFMMQSGELGPLLDDPDRVGERLRLRSYDYHALASLEPPFATSGPPPAPTRWDGRVRTSARNRPSDSLPGIPLSPGTALGRSAVVHSTAALADINPGDILVIPNGGSYWTPLLPAVAAVVADEAVPLSDVAGACRELGVPCLGATVRAMKSIRPGRATRVSSSTGTVTFPDGNRDSDHRPE